MQSTIQTDLANAKQKIILYQIDNGGFPQTYTALKSAGVTASKSVYATNDNNFYYCYNKATGDFAVGGRYATSGGYRGEVVTNKFKYSWNFGVYAEDVCQAIELANNNDPNAIVFNGYTGSSWNDWVTN